MFAPTYDLDGYTSPTDCVRPASVDVAFHHNTEQPADRNIGEHADRDIADDHENHIAAVAAADEDKLSDRHDTSVVHRDCVLRGLASSPLSSPRPLDGARSLLRSRSS
uniref:Uncharacterized protein n=1 Tax=Lotharella globosa TaxID=91324 RepID=A0A7S3YHW2_9EUKA